MGDSVPKRILVIDDEVDIADLVTDVITTTPGRSVFNANSPSEAYMRSLNTKFDLIVSDFKMPKTDGADLIKSIRSQKLNSTTPIIIISGYREEAMAKLSGVPDLMVISKPFRVADFEQAVDQMLSLNENRQIKKPQFDVQLLNEFIDATKGNLRSLAGNQDVATDKPFLHNAKEPLVADISAVINVDTGKFRGVIALGFPLQTYLGLVNGMTKGQATELNDENSKHVGAIASLIYGQVRATMSQSGTKMADSTPHIVVGKSHKLAVPETGLTMVIPMRSGLGEFYLLASAS